jgi:hypothetical protein
MSPGESQGPPRAGNARLTLREVVESYRQIVELALEHQYLNAADIVRMLEHRPEFQKGLPADCSSDALPSQQGLRHLEASVRSEWREEFAASVGQLLETKVRDLEINRMCHIESSWKVAPFPVLEWPFLSAEHAEWIDLAIGDPALFGRGLSEAGFSRDDMTSLEAERAKIWKELQPLPAEPTAMAFWVKKLQDAKIALQHLLGLLDYQIAEPALIPVELPMVWLSAPEPCGCRVEHEESSGEGIKAGWTISFAGIGMGVSTKIQIESSLTFRAVAGDLEVRFATVEFAVRQVTPVRGGKVAGPTFWQVELKRCLPKIGMRSGTPAEFDEELDRLRTLGRIEEQGFALRDSSGDVTEKLSIAVGTEFPIPVKLGLDAVLPSSGVEIGCTPSSSQKVTIGITLKPGSDYTWLYDKCGRGIWWK